MNPEAKREPQTKRPGQPPWHARALQVLTNWCLFLGGASALVIGGRSAFHGDTTLTGVAWGAGVLLLLGATVDRFESLKGLGIEAKTRQLDDKLAEADDALRQIRELSELTGANLIFLHSKLGRWDGPSAADSFAVAQEVKASLTELGSSDAKIRATLDPWVRVTCGDILAGHARELSKALQPWIASLQTQRAARLVQLNGDESRSPELRDQLAAAAAFEGRLREVRSMDLQTLPDGFLKLYDEAPLIEKAQAATLRAAAESFMPVVTSIRDELTIPDPARWCAAIDELLERAARPN